MSELQHSKMERTQIFYSLFNSCVTMDILPNVVKLKCPIIRCVDKNIMMYNEIAGFKF